MRLAVNELGGWVYYQVQRLKRGSASGLLLMFINRNLE